MDILAGLLIFGLGFIAALGLINSAALSQAQAENYLEAINLAASSMDETFQALGEMNKNGIDIEFDEECEEVIGRFKRHIYLNHENNNILGIRVEITWNERGEARNYSLQSLYFIQRVD